MSQTISRRALLAAGAAAIPLQHAMAGGQGERKMTGNPKNADFGSPAGVFPNNPAMREIQNRLASDARGKAGAISARERCIVLVAAAAGTGCEAAFSANRLKSLFADSVFSPEDARECLYQATAYIGAGRSAGLFAAFERALRKAGINSPDRTKAEQGDRRRKGNDLQIAGFGEGIRNFWEKGPADTAPVREFLAENCFGDYYARPGLTWAERELFTFSLLASLGFVPPQLLAHAKANLACGNGRGKLLAAIWTLLPWIGYPSTLNAIGAVDKACA